MIQLRQISEFEFNYYIDSLIKNYAEEQVKSGAWQPDQSLERSRAEVREMLPEGLSSPRNYLFSIFVSSVGSPVGVLWIFLRERNGYTEAFIADLVIFESYRRRGYASQALTTLDVKARELDADKIRLHVYGYNHAARALYEKMDYETVNIYMDKHLK